MKKYIYREGFTLPVDPCDLKNRLDQIEKKYGNIKPEFLIKEAKKKNDILHNLFEWDNEKAAHEHRLQLARRIIISISIVETPTISTFVNVRKPAKEAKEERFYVSTDKALNDKIYREQIKVQCLHTIKYWHKKYKEYGFLSKHVDKAQLVIEEIESIEID